MSPKAVAGLAFIGIAGILVISYQCLRGDGGDGGGGEGGGNGRAKDTMTAVREIIHRDRVKPEAVNRLPEENKPKLIKTALKMTGRGEKADWGLKGMGTFFLEMYLECEAEIISRKETPGGEIKVVEKRSFSKARQELLVSEADVKLDLYGTVPLDCAFKLIEGVGGAMSMIPYPPVTAAGASAAAGTKTLDLVLKSIDGTSAREMLTKFNVKIPERLESKINEFLSKKLTRVFPVKPSDVEGRSYLITYYQDPKTGDKIAPPMRVDIRHADGSTELTDDEWALLRRVNAFIDSDIIDTDKMKIGEKKVVRAKDCECLFDPYVDGSYSGEMTVERKANNNDGDWVLEVHPGHVAIVADTGRTTGEVTVKKGAAAVDAKKLLVKKMVVEGEAQANKLTPHHMLFNARMGGRCSFSCIMTVEDKR